ncbi:MAG: C45 family autoproteolytic acyltransferase/hydrolase, partial [Polyangiales bacterium]
RGIDGLADGAGIPRGALHRAVTMPETYLWVLQRALASRGAPLAPRYGVPLMGCTSALAWGQATRDGAMLHGRNFDYQGVGAWDTEQAVVFHRPDEGQPYVSVSAAGILFGGITAMNASGLTLVVHQHMASDAFELGGTPIGITGDDVMRHAETLDDARRILDDHTPTGCWTYVIGSAKEQNVLCYEVTPSRRACFDADGGDLFAYSNMYLHPEVAPTERLLYPSHWRNNAARWRRAGDLLRARRGDIDADHVASILGDRGEEGCRFEEAISMIMTVGSVVFRPDDGVVWVGTGRAPTSNRPYAAFDLHREAAAADQPMLEGGVPSAHEVAGAFDAYRDSYEDYFGRGDVPAARRHMERARRLQPSEPLYAYVAGLLALLDGDARSAERDLSAALEVGHPEPERVAAFHLWRGRARDRLGKRELAVADYREALSGDRYAAEAARRGLDRAYQPKRFGIEYTLADVPMP